MTTNALLSLLATETSAAVPRISAAAMLAAPENADLRDIWTNEPDNPHQFADKRIAVIATDGVEEIELTTILHFFRQRGATVDLVAPRKPAPPPVFGLQVPEIRETHILTIHFIETAGWIRFDRLVDDVTVADYDAFVIPGGTWNPDTLRAERQVLDLMRGAHAEKKIVAAICHGPWVLADADILKGRRATAWWSTEKDLTNAGAVFVDDAVVIDGNVITSRAPTDLAPFVKTIASVL